MDSHVPGLDTRLLDKCQVGWGNEHFFRAGAKMTHFSPSSLSAESHFPFLETLDTLICSSGHHFPASVPALVLFRSSSFCIEEHRSRAALSSPASNMMQTEKPVCWHPHRESRCLWGKCPPCIQLDVQTSTDVLTVCTDVGRGPSQNTY